MKVDKKDREREREIDHEFELNCKDIRNQLNEQLRCLENRLEIQVAMVQEIQEFFRRKAEVELEYSRNLEKLVKSTKLRHRQEKQKREHWSLFSTFTCWQQLLDITKKESRDHGSYGDVCNNQLAHRLGDIIDNSRRIFNRCKNVGDESHEEIMKALTELQSAMKTYHAYQSDSKSAEAKLKTVETQKAKLEQQLAGKNATSNRKLKSFNRQTEKRETKYMDNKKKALKARNDYLLGIESANASINRYFADDCSDLMDCMDFGYHNSVRCSMLVYQSCHKNLAKGHNNACEVVNKCVGDLDAQSDKQRFIELYNSAFMLPKKFEFQPYRGDEVQQVSAQKSVQDDILQRYHAIGDRLRDLRLENDEVWKTLEETEKSLNDKINIKDYDVSTFFLEENHPPKSPHEAAKRRGDRIELEGFYLEKFHRYTLSCNQIARLQAKYSAIQKALGDNLSTSSGSRPPSLPPKPKKRRIGRSQMVGQPKLFGGSLEEYIEATSMDIPLVIRSCVRAINLYGMHHQGIFRISGAQVEINEFKAEFEKGDDPLVDVDPSDINSVAGVLKLYFRELREPLFPLRLFEELICCSQLGEQQRIEKIKELLATLPRCIIIVMRYLFSFLNHLSEYSDENMMDAYNLAICFGPTLLPIPPDRDQVSFQSNVHEVVKTMIVHQEDLFSGDDGGMMYEKCILEDRDVADDTEGEQSSIHSDEEEEDDDSEIFEAISLYDFDGRTDRELSFKKGRSLLLYNKVSQDWWEGVCEGKEGLIPDKYIHIKHLYGSSSPCLIRPEDKRSLLDEDKMSMSSSTIRSTKSEDSKSMERSISQSVPTPKESSPSIASVSSSSSSQTSKSVESKDTSSSNDSVSFSVDVPSPAPAPATTPDDKIESSVETTETVTTVSLCNSDTTVLEDKKATEKTIAVEKITEELTADIDNALAEVVSGLHMLEMQQINDKRLSLPNVKVKQSAKHTPDLVLDLPEGSNSSPSGDGSEPDSPTSTADTFAKSNQGTLKKANSMPRTLTGDRFYTPSGQDVLLETSFMSQQPLLSTFHVKSQQGRKSAPESPRPTTESIMSMSVSSISSISSSAVPVPPVSLPTSYSPSTAHTTHQATPPPVAEKPKLPPKVKPPVMKKPNPADPHRKFSLPTSMTPDDSQPHS
ncbi:SLIT-ROBO Rho GTPase-activating protein 3-like isoform X3 [Mytilus edulis]|uniref:SLIT-ROBO Rho GTPase-activating protein 3-like isoform X3 n=1 Tax=Mytilus edulis TaxID=6550 RepID=UPI0039EE248A